MIDIKKILKPTISNECSLCNKKPFEDKECPYFINCCVCSNPKISESIKLQIIDEFCLGNYERCHRFKLKQNGNTPPDNLNPYGKSF